MYMVIRDVEGVREYLTVDGSLVSYSPDRNHAEVYPTLEAAEDMASRVEDGEVVSADES